MHVHLSMVIEILLPVGNHGDKEDKSSQNSKPNSKIRINPNLSSKNIIPVMIIYTRFFNC